MNTASIRAATSSKSIEWETDPKFFKKYNDQYHFTIDVCASDKNHKCNLYYSKKQNGLIQDWRFHVVWMNPPYGTEIIKWMRKAYIAARDKGALVVCLVPARTDTNWWHEYAMKGEIEFIRGRLKFRNSEIRGGTFNFPSLFPSAIVVFRPGIPCIPLKK